MTAHKWADEIKAWAEGAEIEQRFCGSGQSAPEAWEQFDGMWNANIKLNWEYRIKTEPKPDLFTYYKLRRSGFFYGLHSAEPADASVCAISDGETKKLKSVRMIGKPDPERIEALLRVVLDEDISLDTRAEIKEALRTDLML